MAVIHHIIFVYYCQTQQHLLNIPVYLCTTGWRILKTNK